MKKYKILYWITTIIVAAMMLFSAFGYFTNEQMKGIFIHLGFPSYFRLELGTAKILGVIVLLIPTLPAKLKDFAYAGFAITFISAFIAHTSSRDGISMAIVPVLFLLILATSYFYYHKLQVK